MVSITKNPDEIKNIEALRLKKYTGCYISKNRTGDFEQFVRNAKAPIEHLFGNHQFCDKSWCWSREIENVRQEIHNDSTNLKYGGTVDQQTSLTNITNNGILDDQAKTFDEIEAEWLEALGITDQDETDSEYTSSSESSNKDDYEGGDYGDEECTNDRVIDEWVAYLEGILDHDDIDTDLEAGNKLFSLFDLKEFKKRISINGTKKIRILS